MSEPDREQLDRVIPEADCPGCDDGTVLEVPEAGYAMCADCGERGYRRGDTVDWWRNDPDSMWYVEEEDDGLRADGSGESATEREDVTDRGEPFVLQMKEDGRPSGQFKLAGEVMAGNCGWDRDGTIAALEEAINNDDVTVEVLDR